MEYLILSFIKVLDNAIMGLKSIAQFKGLKLISSILVTISQFMFYLIIKKVVEDNTTLCIILVSISSGIGNYLAFLLCDKLKRDTKWINYITSSNKQDLEKLCDYLCEHNIKYIVNTGFNRRWEETYNITVFSYTKEQSKLIDNYIKNSGSKYLREIIK